MRNARRDRLTQYMTRAHSEQYFGSRVDEHDAQVLVQTDNSRAQTIEDRAQFWGVCTTQ